MALNRDKDIKLYYSIKEVADEVGVNETTLRYWESVFPQISPKKGANGVRRYTKEDVRKVRLIYHLVKEKGLTLAGAKQHLKADAKRISSETNSEVVERLKAVREELLAIRAALDLLQ